VAKAYHLAIRSTGVFGRSRGLSAALLLSACGDPATFDAGHAEPVRVTEQAVTISTLVDNSAAPLRTQVKVCKSDFGPSPRQLDCSVDPGFALVGGGARTVYTNDGAFLTESEYLGDGRTWRARSIDHTVSAPHELEVYAIGLRLEGVNARHLRNMMSGWAIGAPSDSITSSTPQRAVSGGVSVTTSSPGRMITRIKPVTGGWSAAGKDHIVPAPLNVVLSVRLMPTGIIEGFGALDLTFRTGSPNSVSTGISSSVALATTGWAIVGYGGEATWNAGTAGRMLLGMGPEGTNIRRARAQSKDHWQVSGGSTTVYFQEMRKTPNSHGVCSAGVKLSASMDTCVAAICQADAFCCNSNWDSVCVGRVQASCGKSCTPYACRVPSYNPSFWASAGDNRCYDYANNRVSGGMAAVPGQGAGVSLGTINVASVTEAALADGLSPSTASATCPDGRAKVALAIKPDGGTITDQADYHWYRKDADGKWSHKMGISPPSNLDASGVVITNPETANRGKHTIFGGYFCTCSSNIEGQGHAVVGNAP
jgi:hypothetical protein